PSSGAPHPIEAYVLAARVTGLSRGLYHYNSQHHRLELLRKGVTPAQIETYLRWAMVVSIGSRTDIDECGISPHTVEIRDSARLSRGFDGERALMPDLLPGCDLAEFSAVLHIGSGGF